MQRLLAMIRLGLRAPRTPAFRPALRLYSKEAEAKPETTPETDGEPSAGEPAADSFEGKYLAKDKELAAMRDQYIRLVADFRNLQETTKREIQKAKDFALQKFAKDLLELIDNFGHALRAITPELLENKEVKDMYDGVELTRNVFIKTLNRHGIAPIDPEGEKFDPNRHEALFEVPMPDKEPGTVMHVEQHGYSLNDRVLRPAKVGVVKGE